VKDYCCETRERVFAYISAQRSTFMRMTVRTIFLLILAVTRLHAQERREFRVLRTAEPPKIDGVLNDAAWKQAPLELGEWVSYNPLRGGRTDLRGPAQRTTWPVDI
jgi:hypothetical protein